MAIADQFSGLPLEDLMATPVIAGVHAQTAARKEYVQGLFEIAFEDDKKTTRVLEMTFNRPIEDNDGGISTQIVKVEAPILGIVPVPALMVSHVKAEFTMEIKTQDSSKNARDAEVTAEASVGWGPWKASISGKVTTHSENSRQTDQSAKYTCSIEAEQAAPVEGMSKLMDLLASAVDPIALTKS